MNKRNWTHRRQPDGVYRVVSPGRAGTLLAAAAALLLTASAVVVMAAEGGSGFYLLGQRSQGAGMLPPEGLFVTMPTYFYSGDMSVSQGIEFGGVIAVGIDADIFLTLPTVLWVTPVDVFGGDLALTATGVFGSADIDADFTLTIPGIGVGGVDESDDRWSVGDPAFGAVIGWHAGRLNYLLSGSVNAPVGDYDVGRLSNVALNRWAGDVTAAATWLDPATGIELSGAIGATFNGENDETKYETGDELHLEAALAYHFSPRLSLALSAYHYRQLSADSGDGATLGSFKGRATGFGPNLSANFQAGKIPVFLDLRYYHEFDVKNRPEGDALWMTFTIPLWAPPATE